MARKEGSKNAFKILIRKCANENHSLQIFRDEEGGSCTSRNWIKFAEDLLM